MQWWAAEVGAAPCQEEQAACIYCQEYSASHIHTAFVCKFHNFTAKQHKQNRENSISKTVKTACQTQEVSHHYTSYEAMNK